MKQEIKIGQTDYTVLVFIPDSAQTDGSGKTGLVAANLTCSYVRVETDNDVTVTDVTGSLNNLALLTTAHTDWGILEVSSTLAPGLYRLDIADAVFATGAWSAVVYLCVTTSLASPAPMEFVLVPESPYTGVNASQVGGLTVASGCIPNAVAGAAGGLFIAGTNAATTITTAGGSALTLSSTGANGHGLAATGNGTGGGIVATGGATGPGLLATGGGNHADADGIRAIAGGVLAADLDADIVGTLTGNITGNITGATQLVDDIWDEVLSSAVHATVGSTGHRLQKSGLFNKAEGLVATANAQSVTLDAGASATASIYCQDLVVIIGGTGVGQARLIVAYSAAKVATLDRPWDVIPLGPADSIYQVLAFTGLLYANTGLPQAWGASSIQLATSALAVANSYVGCNIYISSGAGAGQTRLITAYLADRTATVSPAWDTALDATSAYKVIPIGRTIVQSITDGSIANATFAADVGTTAYATNAIALAADKAIVQQKLDHLVAVADADDVVNNSVIAKLASKAATADWSDYNNTTDSLEANRDNIGTAGAGLTTIDLPDQTMNITGNITGNLSGSVGSVTGAVTLAAAQIFVKKNTELANFEFPMVLSSDHYTAATGKTITATRSIDGAAFGACANAVAEVGSGVYKITLAAADTNGTVITYKFSEATCDTRLLTIVTQT